MPPQASNVKEWLYLLHVQGCRYLEYCEMSVGFECGWADEVEKVRVTSSTQSTDTSRLNEALYSPHILTLRLRVSWSIEQCLMRVDRRTKGKPLQVSSVALRRVECQVLLSIFQTFPDHIWYGGWDEYSGLRSPVNYLASDSFYSRSCSLCHAGRCCRELRFAPVARVVHRPHFA